MSALRMLCGMIVPIQVFSLPPKKQESEVYKFRRTGLACFRDCFVLIKDPFGLGTISHWWNIYESLYTSWLCCQAVEMCTYRSRLYR
jgi:hypothetical protein